MKLIKIKTLKDIRQGDTIIITGDCYDKHPVKVVAVKVSEADGTEVIINKRKNHFFNLGMFLEGKSWVKECVKIG